MTRVLIVDDSSSYRMIVRRVLSEDPSIEVVGSSRDGKSCLESVKTLKPDLITLDQMMPVLDGLETLKGLSEMFPNEKERPRVIMISSLTSKDADITVEALRLGAVDFITKPQESSSDANIESLKKQLLPKIKSIFKGRLTHKKTAFQNHFPTTPNDLSPLSKKKVDLILIGASTGGPQALNQILPDICANTELPILIVQHMPAMFTRSLANSLNLICEHRVAEAVDGEPIKPKHVYLAPGGQHLELHVVDGTFSLGLNSNPPENHCRPSVDVLFRSVVHNFKGRVLALILTGMGIDGARHLKELKEREATVLVQDESSSVVWGMPGAAIATDAVDQIVDLKEIPEKVRRFLN